MDSSLLTNPVGRFPSESSGRQSWNFTESSAFIRSVLLCRHRERLPGHRQPALCHRQRPALFVATSTFLRYLPAHAAAGLLLGVRVAYVACVVLSVDVLVRRAACRLCVMPVRVWCCYVICACVCYTAASAMPLCKILDQWAPVYVRGQERKRSQGAGRSTCRQGEGHRAGLGGCVDAGDAWEEDLGSVAGGRSTQSGRPCAAEEASAGRCV